MQPTKQPWHDEKNPEILSALLDITNQEIVRLSKIIRDIEAKKQAAGQQNINIEESLKILRKKFFGQKSEKLVSDRERDRISDDPEVLLHSQNLVPPVSKKITRNLAEETVVHECTEGELASASEEFGVDVACASQWEEIEGLYDQSVEVDIVERTYKKILHKRKKYRLKKEFNNSDKEIIISAPSAVKLVPGSSYSIPFAVSCVIDKYLNHIPLERQCRIMDSLGLHKMSTQVLYNLCRLSSVHLEPIVDKIKSEILSQKVVHSDETPWPINNSKDSDGYMWVAANNSGSYYRFEPSRSGKVVKETLKDFYGTVMTDGYSGYNQFRNDIKINLAMCHAHARRYFFEIKEDYPEVDFILSCYQELFFTERLARDFKDLHELRQRKSMAIIDMMKMWLYKHHPGSRAESALRKAIEYSLNNWKELTKFIEDPFIPLTNNEAERTIRQAVMGRKNFYGSRSIDGADVTAILYSVIESCKKVELDPRAYLLKTIHASAAGEETMTPLEYAKSTRQ